jgi:two-component system chemotaxis response regulator CheB
MAIQALVVDDSALMRKMISDILNSDPEIEVVDTAHDGKDAVKKVEKYKPDIVTMDVEMPVLNGIEAVKQIMQKNPTPVLIVSALTRKGADITMDALQAGAIDFICKPSGSISVNIKTIGKDIVEKVKSVAKARTSTHKLKTIQKPVKKSLGTNIKTLIVDDSPFFIKTTSDILQKHPDIKIIGTATNGLEAVDKYHELKPDVIIMDIDMPEMNGVEATHKILKENFVPVIVFSNETSNDMKDVKTALELGAVDFIAKPSQGTSMHSISQLLVQKIRDARKKHKIHKKPVGTQSDKILLIGTSTGGPQTLTKLVPNIPGDIEAGILIVQHMPPVFTKSLADRLDKISQVSVKEAKEGDEIKPGLALVAPGDYHMEIEEKNIYGKPKKIIKLNQNDRIHGVRPAVDVTFTSAANIYGAGTVAVILTGMGQDGANSMGLIKAKGGYTIAQDEKTSIIFGMPQAAIKLGVVEKILPLDLIPNHAVKMLDYNNRKAG